MKSADGHSLFLSFSTVLASVCGVVTSFVVPFFLVAEEYALYSLIFGYSQLLASLIFEPARIGMIRYAYGADVEVSKIRRGVLALTYLALGGVLLVAAFVCWIFSEFSSTVEYASAVCLGAAAQGVFEGQQSEARARGANIAFAERLVLRSIFSLVAGIACAHVFHSGVSVVIGVIVAYPLAAMVRWRDAYEFVKIAKPNRQEFAFLSRFGVAASLGTSVALAIPSLMRTILIADLGLGRAGGILFVIDIAQRVFATLASTVNVVLVQKVIRAIEFGPPQVVRHQVSHQILVIASCVVPIVAGAWSVESLISEIIVPTVYKETFLTVGVYVLAAMGMLSIRQYALDPLLIIYGRATLALIGPLLVASVLCLSSLLPEDSNDALAYSAIVLLASASFGLFTSVFSLLYWTGVDWPISDTWKLGVATILMVVVGRCVPEGEGHVLALLRLIVSTFTFLGIAGALNLLGMRKTMARQRFGS